MLKQKQAGYTMMEVLVAISISLGGVTMSVMGGHKAADVNGANTIINQVQSIHGMAKETYYPLHDNTYAGLDTNTAIAQDIVPKNLLQSQGGPLMGLVNAYGGAVTIYPLQPMNKTLVVTNDNLPVAVCVKTAAIAVRMGAQVAIKGGGKIIWYDQKTLNWPNKIKKDCDVSTANLLAIRM